MTPRLRTLAVLFAAGSLTAQWPNSPTTNLPIGDGIGEQIQPRIAATSDGGCYLAWFDSRGGSYGVYAQRLDALGIELWPHGGVAVSTNPQNSSLVGWDLICDRDDHCVLAFTDIRAGGDLDVYAYRLNPNGVQVWGANGVALSNNADFEANPMICQASDGDLVFVWPNNTLRTIQMQRVTPAGTTRFPGDGIAIPGDAGQTPGFARVVAADAGSVIVTWVRAMAFAAAKHVHTQKFDAAGTALWNGGTRLAVFDQTSIPIVHEPRLIPDGQGGAIYGWHFSVGQQFFARVQRVLANGTEAFPHNGVDLSTNGNSRFDPAIVWLPASQEILAVFNERNLAQSSWGISAQKVDAAGQLAFGASGLTVIPISTVERQVPQAAPCLDGLLAIVNERLPAPNQYKILAMRIDGAGNVVFAPAIDVSTAGSEKLFLRLTTTRSGTGLAAWTDRRTDSGDVFAQDINPDGSLGDRTAATINYGCGVNPAGSLVITGRPAIGTTMTLGVNNPLGTQPIGSLPLLGLALAPQPGYPCGLLVPGFGMVGVNGEVLLDVSGSVATLLGAPWVGPTQPVVFPIAVPPQPSLYGLQIFAQGVLLDVAPGAVLPVGLTEGALLQVGS